MKGDVITVRKSCGPTAQGGSSLLAASRVIIDQYGKEGRTWLFGSALRRPAHVKPGFRTICRDCDDDWAGLVLKPGLWRKIERTRRFEPRSGKVGWPDDLPQFPGQTQIAIARCDWAHILPLAQAGVAGQDFSALELLSCGANATDLLRCSGVGRPVRGLAALPASFHCRSWPTCWSIAQGAGVKLANRMLLSCS